VLISIAVAIACAFFLLHFQQALISKEREASLKLIQERALQEASVTLLERLYTRQIEWQMIQEQKPYEFPLDLKNWRAKCEFTLENANTKIIADLMHVRAKISLLHKDAPIENTDTTLYFCCKRTEDRDAKK